MRHPRRSPTTSAPLIITVSHVSERCPLTSTAFFVRLFGRGGGGGSSGVCCLHHHKLSRLQRSSTYPPHPTPSLPHPPFCRLLPSLRHRSVSHPCGSLLASVSVVITRSTSSSQYVTSVVESSLLTICVISFVTAVCRISVGVFCRHSVRHYVQYVIFTICDVCGGFLRSLRHHHGCIYHIYRGVLPTDTLIPSLAFVIAVCHISVGVFWRHFVITYSTSSSQYVMSVEESSPLTACSLPFVSALLRISVGVV